jgi:hypothetical protein
VGTECNSALSYSIKFIHIRAIGLLDELEDIEKNSIFNIIDIAISKKRLKDTLSNALNVAM